MGTAEEVGTVARVTKTSFILDVFVKKTKKKTGKQKFFWGGGDQVTQ